MADRDVSKGIDDGVVVQDVICKDEVLKELECAIII
jgi:hypothetical protein